MNQCVPNVLVRPPRTANDSSRRNVALPEGVIDLVQREVRFMDGQRSMLSRAEAGLLDYMASNPGRVISRDEILKHVWRLDPASTVTRTVDMHVSKLRKKLRDNARRPAILRTVSRHGYILIDGAQSPAG